MKWAAFHHISSLVSSASPNFEDLSIAARCFAQFPAEFVKYYYWFLSKVKNGYNIHTDYIPIESIPYPV